jgi:hypothetical protein
MQLRRHIFEDMDAETWQHVVGMARTIMEIQLSDPNDDELINLEAIVEEWQERQASRLPHEEWVNAQETSIREEFPFGLCPRGGTGVDDHAGQAIEVDMEVLQEYAHEAWETLLEMAMRGIRQIRENGPTGDALRRQVAREHGIPLWCSVCNEPAEDIFSEGNMP